MAETPFGRNVNSHVLRRHSFGKENTRRVSESPPTPLLLKYPTKKVALRLTSYTKSYPTHTWHHAGIYSYPASVRPCAEGEIGHNFGKASVSMNSLATIQGASMAIVTSNMTAYKSYGAAMCRACRGNVGPQLGVLYVRLCL